MRSTSYSYTFITPCEVKLQSSGVLEFSFMATYSRIPSSTTVLYPPKGKPINAMRNNKRMVEDLKPDGSESALST